MTTRIERISVARASNRCGRRPQPYARLDSPTTSGSSLRPKGCAACNDTGYAGVVVVAEQLVVNAPLTELILEGASIDEFRTCARSHGMRSMREAGLLALTAGQTIFVEVLSRTAAI